MQRHLKLLIAVTLIVTGTVYGARFNTTVSHLDLKDGDTVVFLGNSITHQCLYTQYIEDYFYTRFPQKRLVFHNSGIGGDKCGDALIRFDMDVASYHPKYVTILLGMNDGRYRSFDLPTFQTYRKDMLEVLKRIEKIDAVPILMTPTMYDGRRARVRAVEEGRSFGEIADRAEYYNATLAYYGAWLRDLALERGYGFVDMYYPLNKVTTEQRRTYPEFTLIPDTVHPGPAGHLVMAAAFLEDMSCPALVSQIVVNVENGKGILRKAENASVSKLVMNRQGGSFTLLENALPWVVPEEARKVPNFTEINERLNREILIIRGLEPGKYSLSIDGNKIGVYSSDRLFTGANLALEPATPQYAQATRIMELNRTRNDTLHVKGLRNYILLLKRRRWLRARLENSPDDQELKDRLKTIEGKLANFDQQVSLFTKRIKEIEREIYKANKPKPHRYLLEKVGG